MALSTKSKPNTHHKKRRAQHHRHSKHYLKTYWPYLPMLMVAIIGLAINNFWTNNSKVLGASATYSTQSLLDSTNTARAQANEPALSTENRLSTAAQAKAEDMVSRNYWSHNSPDGKTPWTFIDASGYTYEIAGENLAYGFADADSTITGWLNSEEHRANLLHSDYSQVGFGLARSSDFQNDGPTTVIVALYARPATSVSTISFTVPNGTVTSKTLGAATRAQPDSRLVSRIEILTGGNAQWSVLAVSLIASGALIIFLIRHGIRLRQLLVEGEVFVMHHPKFDLLIVLIIAAGFILTRPGGVIR